MKRFMLAVLILALSGGVTADEGMWTFDNIPKAEIAKRYGVQLTDQWLAHLQKSVVRLETGCTASFVSVGRARPDESPLCGRVPRQQLERAAGPHRQRLHRREARGRTEVSGSASLGPDEHREHHGSRHQSHRRRRTSGGHRRSQQGADDARSQLRAGVEASRHAAGLRIRHACIKGDSTGSTSTSATTMCVWRLRRSRRSALSAATRTISSSLAGVSTCRCCACTRTANRHRRRTICLSSGRGAKEGEPVFVAGHPGTTQRLLTVAQLKTQRDVLLPFWLAAVFRAARTNDSVLEDVRRSRAHGPGLSR